jgi:hypothetical protein
MTPPPEGNPGQHVYTFVIRILSVSPLFHFSLSAAAALGIVSASPPPFLLSVKTSQVSCNTFRLVFCGRSLYIYLQVND